MYSKMYIRLPEQFSSWAPLSDPRSLSKKITLIKFIFVQGVKGVFQHARGVSRTMSKTSKMKLFDKLVKGVFRVNLNI